MTEYTAMKHTVLRLAELLLAPPLEFDRDGRPGGQTLFPLFFPRIAAEHDAKSTGTALRVFHFLLN
jgi:hypothetical protein